jgi:hypothetical protein
MRDVASRLPRWLIALASIVALGTPALAHGNVTAYVDSFGDLWAIGDDLANNLRIGSAGDDTSVFRLWGGDATTTVNGLSQVTLFAPGSRILVGLGAGNDVAGLGTDYGSDPPCCGRDLFVLTGSGNDTLRGMGPFPSVFADLGSGNDSFLWGEGALDLRNADIRTGDGADVIDIDTGLYDSRIETGAGSDRLTVGDGGRGSQLDLGSGDDRLVLDGGRDFDVQAGAGNDELQFLGIGGHLWLDASDGQDEVLVLGGGSAIEPMSLFLGADDDRLRVGNAWLGAALFDGGSGRDVYLDLGNVFVSGSPELRSFETPLVTTAPELGFSTRITGRVVAELGRPLPGAVVFLPAHGLWTVTDAAGAFRFYPFRFEPGEGQSEVVEVVVGATLRGRARSGAAQVELVPLSNSSVGDIVLAPEQRNILIYGPPPSWSPLLARTLETALVGVGYRRAEVSHLEALPADLSPYGVIWHIGAPIPAAELQRLADFVRAGRGLYLSGGTVAVDASLEVLVNQLVVGGGIDIGGGETGGPYVFNPVAAGGVTRTPHVLNSFSESSFPNVLTGLAPRNVLFTGSFDGEVPAAVWDASDLHGGRGRVALVTSPLWMRGGSTAIRRFVENLQAFLQREPDALAVRY